MSDATAPGQPNVLFICTDQHRFDALGCTGWDGHGNPHVRTPHIERRSIRSPRSRTNLPSPERAIRRGNDHTVPRAIARASYKKQKRNAGVTEFVEIANRGHALTIDGGWREVADTALAFIQRFV